MNPRSERKPPLRTFASRIFNALLWLVFCAMSGTGLLLAFHLLPHTHQTRTTALTPAPPLRMRLR